MFQIVFSKPLPPGDVAAALGERLPAGLRIEVEADMADLSGIPGAVWALVLPTEDPAWPCMFSCLVFGEECGLGPYPDLRIAAWFRERFGTDALCHTYPLVGDLDPQDPYWALAFIAGRWYLASTSGTRLMGPYTDGRSEFPGSEPVRLVRPVQLPEEARA